MSPSKILFVIIGVLVGLAFAGTFKVSISGFHSLGDLFKSDLIMLFSGSVMHFLMGISTLQKESEDPLTLGLAVRKQWSTRSADVLLGVVGAFAGYVVIDEMKMLNAASALGAGYMADSIANAAATKTRNKIIGGK